MTVAGASAGQPATSPTWAGSSALSVHPVGWGWVDWVFMGMVLCCLVSAFSGANQVIGRQNPSGPMFPVAVGPVAVVFLWFLHFIRRL